MINVLKSSLKEQPAEKQPHHVAPNAAVPGTVASNLCYAFVSWCSRPEYFQDKMYHLKSLFPLKISKDSKPRFSLCSNILNCYWLLLLLNWLQKCKHRHTHHGVKGLLLLQEESTGQALSSAVTSSRGEATHKQRQHVPQRDLHGSARSHRQGGKWFVRDEREQGGSAGWMSGAQPAGRGGWQKYCVSSEIATV